MDTKELLKKIHKIEIKTKGLVNQIFSGEYHSVFKGKGIDFSEVREYQIGDDIRNIDWNVTARFGHPYVKIFEEERELTVILMVDLSGSLYFGTKNKSKQELAVELSATLAFSALKNNDKVGLILFTDKIEKFIPPKKNKSHVLRILRELVAFEPSAKTTNIKSALEFLNMTIKKRSIVFLISDFIDDNFQKVITTTSKKHDLIAINLFDEKEIALPTIGLLRIIDAETNEIKIIDTSNKKFIKNYSLQNIGRFEKHKYFFSSNNIDMINLQADGNFIKPLTTFFRKREKRR